VLVKALAYDTDERVRECAMMGAIRMSTPMASEAIQELKTMLGPEPGERDDPKLAEAAKKIIIELGGECALPARATLAPSAAVVSLLDERQKLIGLLRMARKSGDYRPIVSEFGIEKMGWVVQKLFDPEYVRLGEKSLPFIQEACSRLAEAAVKKDASAYSRVVSALLGIAIERIMELRETRRQIDEFNSPSYSPAPPAAIDDEERAIGLLRSSHKTGDYRPFLEEVGIGDAVRIMLYGSTMARTLSPENKEYAIRLVSTLIRTSMGMGGREAFSEAVHAIAEVALNKDLELSVAQDDEYSLRLASEILAMIRDPVPSRFRK
jgi:hypothetical protein